jgi:hypothetical protein
MIVTVKFPVCLRILDSKVRAKINNARATLKQRFGKFRSESMRQREKNNLCHLRELRWIRRGETKLMRLLMMRKTRKNLGQSLSRKLSRRDGDQVRTRMSQKQPHKLFANVTGRPNDGNLRFTASRPVWRRRTTIGRS